MLYSVKESYFIGWKGSTASLVMEAVSSRGTERAVQVLRSGGVVAFPTDTLYGLGADVFCTPAVERVFSIKERPAGMPMPVLIASPDDLSKVAIEVPNIASELAARFWPGPLTIILRRSPDVPDLVSGGRDTLGVRMPNHPVALAMIEGFRGPVTGTSANISGGANPSSWQEVQQALDGRVDHVVEEGPAPSGTASTVLDLTTETPTLVRVGDLDISCIESLCNLSLLPAG